MFKDRAFNLSILFSSIWHLAWISLIGIIVTPGAKPGNFYQEVDFLGPILEKTAFDLIAEEATPQAETLYAKSALFANNIYLKPKGPERKVLKGFTPQLSGDRLTFSLREFIKDTKETPLYFAEDVRMAYGESTDKSESPLIEGPAGEREIIYKSPSPIVSRSLYGAGEEYVVKLKFFISGNGTLYDIEPIVSSGYPEIDLKAIGSLKTWRFAPLNLAKNGKFIWGVVTVKIEAK